ncbi:MAG: acetyl esterase/lipase [Glaciecola sp.]|jgi:acetyl esterase/lipase
MMLRYANHFASEGWVTGVCTYRLSGDAPWPACLEDVKCASRWMHANAEAIGMDADRFGVSGSSAGGTLAALVASTPGLFEGEGGQPDASSKAQAAVLMYPAFELRPGKANPAINPLLDRLFRGCDDQARADASATVHADAMPPTFTVVGDIDPVVPVAQVEDFHVQLDARGIDNDFVIIAGGGHSLDYAFARWDQNFARMRDWFTTHLGAPTGDAEA